MTAIKGKACLHCSARTVHRHTDRTQSGFTLLEILLVIVMIALTSAMIVPSISGISQGSVEQESKRLRLIMRLAMEESQLAGMPLRWLATKHGWSFEAYDEGGEWLPFDEAPLTAYVLPEGVTIVEVQQAGDFTLDMDKESNQDSGAESVVGMVLLLPDGTTSQSNIQLVGKADSASEAYRHLEIRPGPAGIRLKERL